MQDVNVLVVFCSRTGRTEKLALAIAVGAVQAKANIRLRWLREAADERMEKEYVAPREVDAVWAHAIVIAAGDAPPELNHYLASLGVLRREGKLAGTVETVFGSGSEPDALEKARLQGRRVTEAARALKQA